MLLGKIQHVDLDMDFLISFVQQYIHLIQEKTGYNILSVDNLAKATSYVTKFAQLLIGQVSNIIINSIVLILFSISC
jgi:hypothetical protein